jgi:hypothetical protein
MTAERGQDIEPSPYVVSKAGMCTRSAVTAVPFREKECQVRGGGLSVGRPDLPIPIDIHLTRMRASGIDGAA